MMERSVVLMLCWMLMLGLCTPGLCTPSLRFGHGATAKLMSSSLEDPLQPPTHYRSSRSQHVEFRSGRHADAIFTNSYRKVLGQISARKFLQTITGKGSGSRSESEHYIKRQAGIYQDTYKQDLMSIERERSYRKQEKKRRGLRSLS
ncbi:Somatoliberin [Bagarius yarrelli]|uniref:Somatoliberin n=1 Tax=Bagarius yarrelli TaxID=175774 RepID=A0A556V9H5_BAGYA|nr:Somatoliberin [Bagarius yarrelli]